MTLGFAALLEIAEEEQTPEELWQEVKSSVLTATCDYIRKSRRLRRSWLSAQALNIAEERRTTKVTGDSEGWQRLNREFTRQAREDKNAYLEARCEEMEREKSNSKKAFKILRELTGKRTMTAGVINDVDGNTLMEAEDIKRRWAEYCENLYKCQQPEDEGRHLSGGNVVEEPPPLRSEVSWAMDKIKKLEMVLVALWVVCSDRWRTFHIL